MWAGVCNIEHMFDKEELEDYSPRVDVAPEERLDRTALVELENEVKVLAAHRAVIDAQLLKRVDVLEANGIAAEGGYNSMSHWLSLVTGESPGRARQQLRVMHALRERSKIADAFSQGTISYAKVAAIAPVATEATESMMLEWAKESSPEQTINFARNWRRTQKNAEMEENQNRYEARSAEWYSDDDGFFRLRAKLEPEEGAIVRQALDSVHEQLLKEKHASTEPTESINATDWSYGAPTHADALVGVARTALQNLELDRSDNERYQVVVHVDLDTLVTGEGEPAWLEDGSALGPDTARRLACDCDIVSIIERGDEILDVGRKTRNIPRRMRRALKARDKHCRFPGCTRTLFTDGHHLVYWTEDGKTKLENLVLLCRRHHRLVHEHGFTVHRLADGNFEFKTPYGRVIDVPELPAVGADVAEPSEELGINDETMSQWCGDPMDQCITNQVLWELERPPSARDRDPPPDP